MTSTELRDAAKKTMRIVKAIPEGEWPWDDWICICDDWDLNLWEDDDGIRYATLYRIVDGQTQINKDWIIYTSAQ